MGDVLFVDCVWLLQLGVVLSAMGFWSFALGGLSLGCRVGLKMWRCPIGVVWKPLLRRDQRKGQHRRTDRALEVLVPEPVLGRFDFFAIVLASQNRLCCGIGSDQSLIVLLLEL